MSKSKNQTTQSFLLGLLKPYRWQLLAGSLLLLVSAAAMVSLPQYLRHMFDAALKSGNGAELAKLSGYMMLTVLVMTAGTLIRARLIQVTGLKVVTQLRQRLVNHLLTLDVDYFENTGSGAVVSRVQSDTLLLLEFIRATLPMLVRGSLLGVGVVVALFYTSPFLTGILLLAALPISLVGWKLGKKLRVIAKEQQENWAEFSRLVAEMAANMPTITAFAQQGQVSNRLGENFSRLYNQGRRRIVLNAGLMALNVLIGFAALVGVVWLGGLQVMQGHLTLGEMMAYLLYLAFLADAAGNLANFWPAWQETLGSTERVVELLRQKPRLQAPQHTQLLKSYRGGGRSLSFKNVTYTYPARPDAPSLHKVSFEISPGKNIAIVGPSGAGKSTLFRLLLRLDDPSTGTITLGGHALPEYSFAELRSQFALVAQESPLFAGTVAENITFSQPQATEEQIWAALKAAHAEGFVKKLPKGLHTQIGERGVQLSGGQKQRLAIARALVTNAPVLLLDEATSHLDAESERAIQNALEAAGKGKTVLTIAHRLATVKSADEILVMDKGQLVARGTHAELLKKSDLYRALATLQLQA